MRTHGAMMRRGRSAVVEGIHDRSPEDAEIKTAFIAQPAQVVAARDAANSGRRALSRAASLNAVRARIIDASPPADLTATFERAGVALHLAPLSANGDGR